MSFFSTTPKKWSYIKQGQIIGPGAYNINQKRSINQGYAPFGSCQVSKSHNILNELTNLGPGSYQISESMLEPTIKKYQSDKYVILNINDEGSCQFKSNSKRFKTEEKILQTPGPGSYITSGNSRKKSKSLSTNTHHLNKMVRQINRKNVQQRKKPMLVSDIAESEEQMMIQQKRKPKGVINWSLNKKQRFPQQQKQEFRQQNRSQIIAQIKQKKKQKKINQNSVFKSRSAKSLLQCSLYKTNNPYKMEIKKLIGFKDTSPAPGTYQISNNFRKRVSNQRFQFFGSTAARFQQMPTIDEVGPGYYKPQISKNLIKKKPPKKQSKISRSSYIESDPTVPGPGSYEIAVKNSLKQTKNGTFGSLQPRFNQIVPSCGVEEKRSLSLLSCQQLQKIKRKQEQFEIRKNIYNKQNNYFFKSSKARDCFEDIMNNKAPFGQYNISNNDISYKMQKIAQAKNHFKECHIERPAFLSSQNRFKVEKQSAVFHKDCWCQMKHVEKRTSQLQTCHFRSNSRRIQVFDSKYKAPPIGYYEIKSPVVKDSFNAKFLKTNMNKKKKMTMWKQFQHKKNQKQKNDFLIDKI